MKNYIKPVLEDSSVVLEGVYAASGSIINPPPEDNPPFDLDGWGIRCEFRGHNSGSHSEVAIICEHHGKHAGEGIRMNFRCGELKLDYIKDFGGQQFSNVSETGFTCFRNGHFNANDRIEFNCQIVVKERPYHGAYGVSGEYTACPIQLHSFMTC